MAIAITIPRLGWNMEQGVFVGWLKRDGDPVRSGDPLFTLEGEKATQEIEANDQGILRIAATAPEAGGVVAVGTVIGHLLDPGEADPVESSSAVATALEVVVPAVSAASARDDRPNDHPRRGRPAISPLARRVAQE